MLEDVLKVNFSNCEEAILFQWYPSMSTKVCSFNGCFHGVRMGIFSEGKWIGTTISDSFQ